MARLFCSMVVCAAVLSAGSGAMAQESGLDSPREAMFTFLEAINRVELARGDLDEAWAQALGAMDTSGVGPDAARQAARQLNEVLDKLGTVQPDDLPDALRVNELGIGRYTFFPDADGRFQWVYDKLEPFGRFPDGQIVFERGGDGNWRFSGETVSTISALAESMKPLPPLHGEPIVDRQAQELVGRLGKTFQNTEWWQWAALGGCIFLGLLAGRITSYTLRKVGDRLVQRDWAIRGTFFQNLASPSSLALLTIGLMVGLTQFIQLDERLHGFVLKVIEFLFLLALGWFLYNLIDVIDVLLRMVTDRTDNRIDDMVVPLIRKTLRIFLVVVFALVVAENVFGMDVTGFLAGLGIAGLAVSLAAQDSVKNLFGSLTIFFDKPFLIGDFITFDGETGTVEEIGFRSTRIRLLSGHLVTVPNMKFIDGKAENISARPYIRREMNVTITYDTPPDHIEQAVDILRGVLNDANVVERGMFDMENQPPRVSFNELNADSLNIKAYYWYRLPRGYDRGWFTFLEHCQLVNMMLFRRYADAGIDFAFPTQTLYLAGDEKRELAVTVKREPEQRT